MNCSDQQERRRVSIKTIDYLFLKFAIRYQDAWASRIKSDEWLDGMKADWFECLEDLGISEIKNGLRNLSRGVFDEFKKFPPNAMQFRDVCLYDPEFPSMHECFVAAIKGEWGLHPIVEPTAKACDLYWLRRASEKDAMRRFSGYYDQMRKKFLLGQRLVSNPEIEYKAAQPSGSHWADIEIEKRMKGGESLH